MLYEVITEKLKEVLFVGLIISSENYTLETIMLYLGYYIYPYSFPGYPDVVILSSIFFFPILGMLYYQYLSGDIAKNLFITLLFLFVNMISELIGLYTKLFIYKKGLNIGIAFLLYLGSYLFIFILKQTNKKFNFIK